MTATGQEIVLPTKGTWLVVTESPNQHWRGDGTEIASEYGRIADAGVYGLRNLDECRANARLIAAAPDLLALAQKLAGECAECRGRGYTFSDDGITGFGPDDREPTREACADCADIREVIAKAVSP